MITSTSRGSAERYDEKSVVVIGVQICFHNLAAVGHEHVGEALNRLPAEIEVVRDRRGFAIAEHFVRVVAQDVGR